MTMKFSLDWYGTKYENDSVNGSLIWDAINGFCEDEDDYIVLEPESPLLYSIYIQTHSPNPGDNGIMPVEIRFAYDDGTFSHYSYETSDKKEIYDIFANYWSKQELPDYSRWNDISNNM